MRYILHIISLTIFLTISYFCYQLYKMHAEEMEKLNKQVEEIFWKAVHEDSDLRLKETKSPWVKVVASDNEIIGSSSKGGVTIKSKEGIEFIPYGAQFERPPQHLRGLFRDQTFLETKNPLSVVRLDSMFKVQLKDLLPDAVTLVYCCSRTKDTVAYSIKDTALCKSRIASPSIEVGVKRELILRGYVKYPVKYMAKAVWFEVYPFLFLVLLLLGGQVYLYYRLKRSSTSALWKSNSEENRNEHSVSIDSTRTEGNQPFYFRGKKLISTDQNLVIFKLFLTKSDFTLEHREIICALWGNKLFEYRPRFRKSMQRFREFLKDEFPDAELVSIKGKGYRLHFSYEDKVPAPETSEQEDQPAV